MDKEIFMVCQRCVGTGVYKKNKCPDCGGTGRVLFGFLVEEDKKVKATKLGY